MFLTGLTIQGLLVVNIPSYVPKPYQEYLFAIILPTIGLVANTLLARTLPKLEWVMAAFFTLAFLAIVIALWVISPRLTAAEVFQTIKGGGGWSSLGLNLLTAQSAIMFLIVGSDATAHMAEETKDASTTIPKAMITSYMANASLSFVMIVTYCFILTDFEGAYESPVGVFGLPSIQVFVDAVGSIAGATAMQAILIVIAVFSCTNWMASSARQVFAFARDHGLPYGSVIARVNSRGTYPINALIFAWFFVVLINLISLGSIVAFDAITSLQILALMSTYLISVSCIIWRRLFGEPLPPSPWTLGRFALPINLVGWFYCVYLITFLPWPVEIPVTPENFNWASVMFVGIMALSAVYYIVYARKIYKGPVVYVKKLDQY